MAEREGFEPSKRLYTPYSLSRRAPSTTRPPLHDSVVPPHASTVGARRHLVRACTLEIDATAEGVGFEPTRRTAPNGFQDRLLRPLGHPSWL